MGQKPDIKSQLVSEICSIACADHTHKHSCASVKSSSPFIDWYRILGVEENAGTHIIRKQYHRLALQLHPDKNKHPKAEIAFKLVLEAYLCLSDNIKRKAFNLERWKNFCTECTGIPYIPCNTLRNSFASERTDWDRGNFSRSYHVVLQGLKEIRERFKEEAEVMENCLKGNAASRKESPGFQPLRCRTRKESPVFDPSDYRSDGYPHMRNHTSKTPEKGNFCYLQRKRYDDSPIFGSSRSDTEMFKRKSTYVQS